MRTRIPATLCLLFAFTGLSLSEEGKQQSQTRTEVPPQRPVIQSTKDKTSHQFNVIGYLEKRDRIITIKSGPKGTVYTVATKDGKVLHDNLTVEQLKAQVPDLHDLIKTGVAGDARLRIRAADAQPRVINDARR